MAGTESEDRVAAFVETLPLPVLVIGRDSRIMAANARALARFGAGLPGRHYLMSLRQPALQAAVDACLSGAWHRVCGWSGRRVRRRMRCSASMSRRWPIRRGRC